MEGSNKVKEFFTSTLGRVTVTVVSAIIIYGILMMALSANSEVIFIITFLICGYFGWNALSRITPNIFLVMSLSKWAIYFLIKGLLAVCVGAFVAPFQIGKMISNKLSETMSVE